MKEQVLEHLNRVGICVLEDHYDEAFCIQAVEDINNAIKEYPDKIQSEAKEGTSGDSRVFKMENKYETAKAFANDSSFLEIGSSYFGSPIVSHFVLGGKVEYTADVITNSGGGWHRDNRMKQIKTIVYLTDVTDKSGGFMFLPSSNLYDLPTRDGIGKVTRYSDEVVNEFCTKNNLEPFHVTGKRGTVIFVDTSYIHRGANIEEGERYTYTNYYFENDPSRLALSEQKWGKHYI